MAPVIGVGIVFAGQGAQTRGAADQGLVEPLPKGRGPHESLVVEPGDQQRREQLVHRHQVEAEAGPAVLAVRRQALMEFYGGGPSVGLGPGAPA